MCWKVRERGLSPMEMTPQNNRVDTPTAKTPLISGDSACKRIKLVSAVALSVIGFATFFISLFVSHASDRFSSAGKDGARRLNSEGIYFVVFGAAGGLLTTVFSGVYAARRMRCDPPC